jgi:pyrrolidone-carboxylate peptidase
MREFAGQPANYGRIDVKVRRLSGNLGATLEFRTVPIFATEGRSILAKRLRANLGLVVMVGHSGGRWGVSVC